MLFADGVFETWRGVRGVMLDLDAHLDRLAAALARLEIPWPSHLDETVTDAIGVLRAAGEAAAVRLTVTRGLSRGLLPTPGTEPTSMLLIQPCPTIPPEVYSEGLATIIATGRRNEAAPTAGLKTLSYTDHVVALMEARRLGADDAILLDTAGHAVEGTTSNLFLVEGDEIATPPLSCGVLPGITRATVIALAAQRGTIVQEHVIARSDLETADEIFLTSSLRGIAPVTRVAGAAVGGGRHPGPVTRRLMDGYARRIAAWVADELAVRAST